MRLTRNSPTAFTPDSSGWTAAFTNADGNTWTEPVIGWAIAVNWAEHEERDNADDPARDIHETQIQAVVLDEGYVVTESAYCVNRDGVHLKHLIPPSRNSWPADAFNASNAPNPETT